jgi:hypothetical protein
LRIDAGARANFQRVGGADAEDVAQRDVQRLLGRNIDACDTCHERLSSKRAPGGAQKK